MERIDPSGRSIYSPRNKNKKKIRKQNGALSFSALVEGEESAENRSVETTDSAQYESLERMLDEIHGLGEKIRENVTYEMISRYRTAVRAFLKHVVASALVVESKQSTPNVLRQKKFTLVKVIDQKLERLASGVFMNQHETFDILARIDEINGLLIDLIR